MALFCSPVIPPYENAPAKRKAPFSPTVTGAGVLPKTLQGTLLNSSANLATALGEKSFSLQRVCCDHVNLMTGIRENQTLQPSSSVRFLT